MCECVCAMIEIDVECHRSLIPRFHRLTRAGPPGECDCSTWQARSEPSLPSRDTSITSVLNQYRTPLTPRIPCTGSCCALALLPGALPWLIMLDNTCWGGPRAMEHMISEFRRSCKRTSAQQVKYSGFGVQVCWTRSAARTLCLFVMPTQRQHLFVTICF